MNIKLTSIERDTTIQCRAKICMETVNSYAEAMTEGAKFPAVVLFGTKDKCWIGDGWHRVMAAEQIDALDIPAEVLPGGKDDALWYAMGANKAHGLPMKRGDVKRAVELAVKTWPNKSQQEIANQIGCSQGTVSKAMAELIPRNKLVIPATRIGADGKSRPTSYATRKHATPEEEEAFYFKKQKEENERENIDRSKLKRGHPSNGMQFARMAILDLEQITDDDTERVEAFEFVKEWINENYESKNTEND